MNQTPQRILFFDVVCNLCNGFVDFMIQRDRTETLFFSSLQSEQAQKKLNRDSRAELISIIYLRDGEILMESTAVLYAMADLGGFWVLLKIFLIIPGPLRNSIYQWVARHRYRWFGKRDTCRLPTEKEKSRFL
ncbi:MAG: DUF393 domain-containing protein [Bdellovibrionales bacterium]|nr:DUF393 domain-containing protein [Bdellovibrionales bacterium]